jgi:hypothetical protein
MWLRAEGREEKDKLPNDSWLELFQLVREEAFDV